jgi:electron transfer flavoprotein beta subunit
MLEGTNQMRFASLEDMLRAGRFAVRRWSKEDAGIDDLGKIGLKGSPTVVSKVFGPTPRQQKCDVAVVADSSVNDVTLNLLQKIFTTHPQLEQEMVDRLSA